MSYRTTNPLALAVLLGGNSAEREVSLQSGATVIEGLETAGHRVRAVDTADRDWQAQLSAVDCAFIALHGPGGEDGCLQGALEFMGLPYTGSGVLGSALAMDKQRTKQLWQGIGLPTAGFELLGADSDWQQVIERLGKVFVKPACEGSSIGMAPAATASELEAAYRVASTYAGDVIAEKFIDGPEFTVGVLGGRALPSIRIEAEAEFYDYEAKYVSDGTRYHVPSGLSDSEEGQLAAMSLAAFSALDCSIWGRVDLMRDADGSFYLLEINTSPGMTSHSLVPMAARAAGIELPELVDRVVQLALEMRG
ncbi:MAG: D-alanine--D-alanine ligase [Pseudomonadota bacterium]